ncbi:MAG: IS30 family transposase, partial [Candidatus Levyibacteriota bacterium]
MKRYQHITLEERERLYALREQGKSFRFIAKILQRSQSSLSRELKRNIKYGEEFLHNEYLPCKAQKLAEKRALKQRYKAPLKNPQIFLYVREHLRKPYFWSPGTIAGRLRRDHPGETITKETIYRYVYAPRKRRGTEDLRVYLTLHRKKRMKLEGRRVGRLGKIPGSVSIEKRSKAILGRKRIGHWETDNVIGKQTDKTALSVTVERKSRFTIMTKLKDRTAKTKTAALVTRLSAYPTKTLTADNGKENSQHGAISAKLALLMYFCHSYASWEKGTVENTNGRIRRMIPKGESIDTYSEKDIEDIEIWLNNTPR